MKKILISLSGGMDSVTLLAKAIHEGYDVFTIGFYYGSKHNSYENAMAKKQAEYYKVPFKLLDISSILTCFKSDLLLSGECIPEGHFQDDSMKRTIVPARNIIFISILTGIAESENISEIWLGIHSGDHAIYPDCRPAFYYHMKKVVEHGTDHKVTLQAPFLEGNKITILEEGLSLKVPYELTRTCYKEQELSCGKCGSCIERLESFVFNNTKDPLNYE